MFHCILLQSKVELITVNESQISTLKVSLGYLWQGVHIFGMSEYEKRTHVRMSVEKTKSTPKAKKMKLRRIEMKFLNIKKKLISAHPKGLI